MDTIGIGNTDSDANHNDTKSNANIDNSETTNGLSDPNICGMIMMVLKQMILILMPLITMRTNSSPNSACTKGFLLEL